MPTAETTRNDHGKRILEALDEVLDWTKGNGTLLVTLPGQPAREMTREEYETASAPRSFVEKSVKEAGHGE